MSDSSSDSNASKMINTSCMRGKSNLSIPAPRLGSSGAPSIKFSSSQNNNIRHDEIMGLCSWRSPTSSSSNQIFFNQSPPQTTSRGEKNNHRATIMAEDNWRIQSGSKASANAFKSPSWRSIPKTPSRRELDSSMVGKNETRSSEITPVIRQMQIQILKEYGESALKVFTPSWSAMQASGLIPNLDSYRAKIAHGILGPESNYLGDVTIQENLSANIHEEKNCALWVMGLPADVTYQALFAAIRNVGRVSTCWIKIPNERHELSAAKIVFFTRKQAERLFTLWKNRKFVVMNREVGVVRWNKNKSSRYPHSDHSRCVRITGPEHLMDFGYFETFFEPRFTYQLDRKFIVECSNPAMVAHEWHFGSVRCQSLFARTAIERELKGIYITEFVKDPCQ